MAVPVRVLQKKETTGDLGEQRAMHLHKPCRYAACVEHGIASVGDEDLCCDHFVLRSYEFLEQIDAERAKHNGEFFVTAGVKDSVNSCLQGALEVSLRSESLNNLQKARLLDIMLWAGQFIHLVDNRRLGGGTFAVSLEGQRQRAAYSAPRIKTRTILLPQ
ncbi:MAG: hypothetical protein NVS9B14_00190 [Candidatus Acidiferrum sp.]